MHVYPMPRKRKTGHGLLCYNPGMSLDKQTARDMAIARTEAEPPSEATREEHVAAFRRTHPVPRVKDKP